MTLLRIQYCRRILIQHRESLLKVNTHNKGKIFNLKQTFSPNLIEELDDGANSRSSSFVETEFHVFLLANPRSGSQEATRYTGLDF